jgi:ATP-binding cassette subfamily B protein
MLNPDGVVRLSGTDDRSIPLQDADEHPAASGGLVDLAPPVRLRVALTRLWPFIRPFPGRLIVIALSAVIAPALATATTWLFKVVIDEVIVPGNLRAFGPVAAAFAVIAVLQGIVGFSEHYLTAWTSERFSLGLRTELFRHLHDLTPDFFERRSLGDTVTRVNADIDVVQALIVRVSSALNHIFLVLFFGVALFVLDWRLALASLLVSPCIAVLVRRFSHRVRVASRERGRRLGNVGGITEESLANAALVRAYGRAEAERMKFVEQNLAGFSAHMAAIRLQALFGPLAGLVQLVGTLLVFGVAAWEISHDHITIGGLMAFLTYLGRMSGPIQEFGDVVNSIFSATASAERVLELLDQSPALRECARPRRLCSATGSIHFHDVTFTYPTTEGPALVAIDFRATPGQKVAVIGASGAGKTTLAKLLLRFYDPGAGSITLDGIDLRELSLDDLYRNISVVLQETLVFDSTIRENIAWGKPGATAAEIAAAARAADAHEFISLLPDGYDTRVGQRGRLLSGGQRQRVAIARALIRDAPVLILDEPATGLDAQTTHRVMAPMRRLMAGRTTIVISHNLLTVADADLILFLDRGVLAGSGTHEHLLAENAAYAELHRLHQWPCESEVAARSPITDRRDQAEVGFTRGELRCCQCGEYSNGARLGTTS